MVQAITFPLPFTRMSNKNVKRYWRSHPDMSNNDTLGMGLEFIDKLSSMYAVSLANVINRFLESYVFERDWKSTRVAPI